MPYSRNGDAVTLTITVAQHQQLLYLLGLATGYLAKQGNDLNGALALVNDLNAGNPNYTPYAVETEGK